MIYIEGDKDALINPLYLEPGSDGSDIFVPGSGTRTVFLDPGLRNGYQEGTWLTDLITYSQEPVLDDHFGPQATHRARTSALEANGGISNTARFYERFLAELLGEEIDIKHIMTGVTRFTGKHYHDFGYLAVTGTREV